MGGGDLGSSSQYHIQKLHEFAYGCLFHHKLSLHILPRMDEREMKKDRKEITGVITWEDRGGVYACVVSVDQQITVRGTSSFVAPR